MKNKLALIYLCLLAALSLAGCNASPISSFGEAANGREPVPVTDPKTVTAGSFDSIFDKNERKPQPIITLEGDLDSAKAMRVMYGTYNPDLKRAQWKPTKEELDRFSFYNNINTLYSRAYFTKSFQRNGAEHYLVITRTEPAKSECKECVPVLGGAVFAKNVNNDNWTLNSQSRMITRTGALGELSPGRLVKIGSDNYGVLFHWKATHMGITEEGDMVIAETKSGLKEVFSMITGGNNKKHCEDVGAYADDPACWSYRSKIEFLPTAGSTYYELRVTSDGTKPIEGNEIIAVRDNRRFAYSESGYRPLR